MDSLYVVLKSIQDSSYSTQYLSLVIALLAVFFGPIISYFTAKLTIRAQLSAVKEQTSTQISIAEQTIRSQVLSKNRQEWINMLRDNISEFVALLLMVSLKITVAEEFQSKFQKMFAIRLRISLLLNPTEGDHQQLETFLEQGVIYMNEKIQNKDITRPFPEIRADITNTSQKILKREWERVKKIE